MVQTVAAPSLLGSIRAMPFAGDGEMSFQVPSALRRHTVPAGDASQQTSADVAAPIVMAPTGAPRSACHVSPPSVLRSTRDVATRHCT
jgi:hypothetical protein